MKHPHVLSATLVLAPSGPLSGDVAAHLRAALASDVAALLARAQQIADDKAAPASPATADSGPPPEVIVIITQPPPSGGG